MAFVEQVLKRCFLWDLPKFGTPNELEQNSQILPHVQFLRFFLFKNRSTLRWKVLATDFFACCIGFESCGALDDKKPSLFATSFNSLAQKMKGISVLQDGSAGLNYLSQIERDHWKSRYRNCSWTKTSIAIDYKVVLKMQNEWSSRFKSRLGEDLNS